MYLETKSLSHSKKNSYYDDQTVNSARHQSVFIEQERKCMCNLTSYLFSKYFIIFHFVCWNASRRQSACRLNSFKHLIKFSKIHNTISKSMGGGGGQKPFVSVLTV
jgi:hypothetical protein